MANLVKLRILMVEDNRTDAALFSALVRKSFTEGQAHIDLVTKLSSAMDVLGTSNYDLIFVDLNLPDSQGIETVQKISSKSGSIPFVILTSSNDDTMALLAIRLGAQDYVVKRDADEHYLRRVIQHSIERRKMVSELLLGREQLRQFTHHAPAALAMFDSDGRYIMVTQRWLKVFHDEEANVIGRHILYDAPKAHGVWDARIKQVMKGGEAKGEEEYVELGNGHSEQIKWEMMPWRGERNDIGGVTMFAEVVTKERALKRELQSLNKSLEQRVAMRTAELEAIHENRTRFYTNITHEIRTPLHAIINFSSFGKDKLGTVEPEKILDYFESIYKSGKRLLWLVNYMLDMAKLQQGQFDIHIEPTSLTLVMEDAAMLQKASLEERGMTINYEVHDVGCIVEMDADRITQVLQNLISNSIKFSPPNTVITVASHEHDGWVDVMVSDQGPGIPEEQLEDVFDEFAQSDKVRSGTFATGTGLGLAICKEIIHSHGGTIHASNLEDAGACLTIRLPKQHDM